MRNGNEIVEEIKKLHQLLSKDITKQTENQTIDKLSSVAHSGKGDLVYNIEKNSDNIIDGHLPKFAEKFGPALLISESIGEKIYGAKNKEECAYAIIIDPLDGTRELMYDLRSAWILTGVAPNKPEPKLKDIEIAVQTEIPTTKQFRYDVFSANGNKTIAERHDKLHGNSFEWKPQPSRTKTIEGGFAFLTKFFEGAKTKSSEIEEELFKRLGLMEEGKAKTFDDQYICSAGQFAMLFSGSYRFCGDLRPYLTKTLSAHPYDVCTKPIADNLGIEITDVYGNNLDVPLDTKTGVSWFGYANKDIRNQVEPVLLEILEEKVPNY